MPRREYTAGGEYRWVYRSRNRATGWLGIPFRSGYVAKVSDLEPIFLANLPYRTRRVAVEGCPTIEPALVFEVMEPRGRGCLYIARDEMGTKDRAFDCSPEGVGFKNLGFMYPALKEALQEVGIEIATRDIHPPESADLVIAVDNPHALADTPKSNRQLWVLIMQEPPIYAPETWDQSWHDRFDLVMTYDRRLVDHDRYWFLPIPVDTEYFSLPDEVSLDRFRERILALNVSNAVQRQPEPSAPSCTHWRRYRTISWYGRHRPNDFGFYSGTFMKRYFYFEWRGAGLLRRVAGERLFQKIASVAQRNLIRVFKGPLPPLGKFDVLREYNFYYCYENTTGIPGYVSEKIFDCLYYGIVPIYWGAPDVGQFVPPSCFIDGEKFSSDEDVYEYISTLPYDEYARHLAAARNFLASSDLDRLTVRAWVDHLLAAVLPAFESRGHADA